MKKINAWATLFISLLIIFFTVSCQKKEVFPKTIEVCPHYNCADATVIQLTDQYFPSNHNFVKKDSRKYTAAWAEFLAFKYNIPLHVFEQNVKGQEFEQFLKTGRGGASIYYPSCHFEYRKSKLDSIKAEVEEVYGKSISTLSYGCGKTYYADSLPNYILGGRTSEYVAMKSNSEVSIQYETATNLALLKRPAAGRYYTEIQRNKSTVANAALYVKNQVKKTIDKRGFYTNFMHWHDYYKNSSDSLIEGVRVMEAMFKAMHEGMVKSRNSGLDYNEAVEYLFAKEAVDSVKILKSTPSTLTLGIQLSKKTDLDYNNIDTPITLRLRKDAIEDFEMDRVEFSDKIKSVLEDDENYYLNLLLNFDLPENIVTFSSKKEPVEILELENALRINKSWFFRNVKASSPSKFILFRRKKEAINYEIEIVVRTTTFSEKYELPEFEEGYDYFCGAIDKKRQSTLIEL